MKSITKILIIIIAAAAAACSSGYSEGGEIDEGVITYNMRYPRENPRNRESSLIGLFPQQVKMYFKDNKTAMHVKGFFFSLKYINPNNGKTCTLFHTLNHFLVYEADSSKLSFGYGEMGKMNITRCQDTMTIGGYLCNKALASNPESGLEAEVWYTDKIKISNANAGNPFGALGGVPMKFSVVLCGFYMEAEAERVEPQNEQKTLVTDEEFKVPQNYEQVTAEGLSAVFHNLTRNK